MIGVETLIAIAGQLIGLIKARKEYKDDEFSTFVEPLYIETEKVISDYIKLFQNTADSIRSNRNRFQLIYVIRQEFNRDEYEFWQEKFSQDEYNDETVKFKKFAPPKRPDDKLQTRKQIAENYEKDRQGFYTVRAKIRELARVYSESKLSNGTKDFAKSILKIFNATSNNVSRLYEMPRTSQAAEVLNDENMRIEEAMKFLEEMIMEIRENWNEATEQFARLHVKSKR